LTTKDPSRYTITTAEAMAVLKCSRDTVHNLAESSELSFVTRPRGSYEWRYFDPEEVEALARKRNGEEVKP